MKLSAYRDLALFVVALAVSVVFVSGINANEPSLAEAFNVAHSFLSASHRASMPAQAAKPASQVVGTVSTPSETIPERIKKLKEYVAKNGGKTNIDADVVYLLKFTPSPRELATRQISGDDGTDKVKATARYFFAAIVKTPDTAKYSDDIILIKKYLDGKEKDVYRVNSALVCESGLRESYNATPTTIDKADCQAPVKAMLAEWADSVPSIVAPATADRPLSNNPKSLTASQSLK